jgi:hypothetical protein
MKSLGWVLVLLMFVAQPPKPGKVASEYDKKTDFSKYRTYTWMPGLEARVPEAHTLIVAGIDREMSGLGLTRVAGADADLTVTYHSLRSTYINLKELEKAQRDGNKEQAPTYDLGKLVIVVHENGSKRQLWAANTAEYLRPDPAAREQTINQAVTKIFATYPTRRK